MYNKRLVAQGGIFTYIIPDKNRMEMPESQRYDVIKFVEDECTLSALQEYVIKFNTKKDITLCRMFLTRIGINPGKMFPDLRGIVDDCMYRIQSNDYAACPLPMTSRDINQIMQKAKRNRQKK